jgi:hypothetical protein
MTDTLQDPPLQTGQEVGRVETDMFCSNCGYNLHSLAVILDHRLGIPTVRCAECGKFHAAGLATGSGRLWLSRLARILILLWVLFLLTAVVGWGLAMFSLDIISVDAFSRYQVLDPEMGGRWGIVESSPSSFGGPTNYFLARGFILACSIAAGFGLGALASVFIAHIRRPWLLFLSVVPLAVGGFVAYMYEFGGMHYLDRTFPLRAVGIQVTAQLVGLSVGVPLGRMAARVLLRVLLPRKILQHVSYLWQVDGREFPAPRAV